jgi:hypothetical protein
MDTKSKTIIFRTTPDLDIRLRNHAGVMRRSLSAQINYMLELALPLVAFELDTSLLVPVFDNQTITSAYDNQTVIPAAAGDKLAD